MDNHQESRLTMAAEADIVLNTAVDPARARAWIPLPVHTIDADKSRVELRSRSDDDVRRYEVELHADRGRVEWRPIGHDGWPGHLEVTEHGAGSSEAKLVVRTPDGADPAEVRGLLDQALRDLAAEVDQNFTVS